MMTTPIKDPSESVVIEFDFSAELQTIDSATVSIAVVGAVDDPGVAQMLVGAAQINGASVLQRIEAGVPGARYKVRAVATGGEDVRVLAGMIAVQTA